MARNKKIKIKLARAQKEQVEFYTAVTFNTGIGGRAPFGGFDKMADNLPVKFFGKIEHIVINAQIESHVPRVVYIRKGTTAALSVKQFERYADTLKTLFKHKGGGDRTVNAARHGDYRFLAHNEKSLRVFD
jgi:hypothetical protein